MTHALDEASEPYKASDVLDEASDQIDSQQVMAASWRSPLSHSTLSLSPLSLSPLSRSPS